ncbi:hypothetical protein SAMN02910301_0370 [Lachnospiraceae bacterium XBD2001]|nr:hypothetical protein SAMN02910301_0370 [Lachnospiraceae bacterium XBD2001]
MSKRNRRFLGRVVLFTIITTLCIAYINHVMVPKTYYYENWPATNTFGDFYQLEKNSVDVLFMGSSHAASSYNPQVIYDNYGITSYNLGSEQQSIVMTYYWLREALKYQSPKVVVLDPYTVHLYVDSYAYNDMNCSETAVRRAMDSMRFSLNKLEAALVVDHYDPKQDWLSFFLTNIRYHERWKSVGEEDYTERELIEHGGMKGYAFMTDIIPSPTGSDFTIKASDINSEEPEDMVGSARKYLDKIRELCDKEGIRLVFSSIPCYETIGRYRSIKEYADTYGIDLYDFNEDSLYQEIGYSSEEYGYYHPNYLGAAKISMYLGKVLSQDYQISPREDASYDVSRANYEHRMKMVQLASITDAQQYFEAINDDAYSIFIFGPLTTGAQLNPQVEEGWKQLGLSYDLTSKEEGQHYWAIRTDGNWEEHVEQGNFQTSGSFRDNRSVYSYQVDDTILASPNRIYSVNVDGMECGNQNNGVDIVVYDNEYHRVIDRVNIDTTVEDVALKHY